MNRLLSAADHPEPASRPRAMLWIGGLALATALFQAGCASFPPPNEQLAVATAAVESAARSGATELAPTDMAKARDKLARANASMMEAKHERALMLAEAALVDARLAEARARSATANKAAVTVGEDNRVLRQEIERGATQ